MRRSSLTMLLSTLALVACSSAGGSNPADSASGNAGSADGNPAHADGGSAAPGMSAVSGGGSHGDAGADAAVADAAPQVTPDGCVISSSPAQDA